LTAGLLVPLTTAFSATLCPEVSEAVAGVSETEIATSEITVLAEAEESAWLVAVIVTVCVKGITAGAV
jgi:hypothetical protein